MELIRYHLPTFVKHVLAPKNEFGMPKMTWRNYKSFGIRATPSPHIVKNSQKMSFFYKPPYSSVRQSPKNLVCGYALHTGKFLRVRKVFARIEKIAYKMKPELLSALKSDYLKTFRTVRKLSRLSGNLPNYLETLRTVRKFSRLSGNFPDCP